MGLTEEQMRKLSDAIHEVGQYRLGARLDPTMSHRLKLCYDLLQDLRSELKYGKQ